ncbi:hypothetical protein CLAFUW4_06477 [Fulvia fulva]|uniref:Uncharacterized protein n=1 Tax=Passalora fulva TaxID=5499 RepID=A0A9Q8UQV0_PASFU|nr:uncharacterized protein CLAFUR5_06621 [Fulvia fulva]KAK4622291.1 hypothetical protein CLAFUR4_06481 [Fulvia fulva]KAK4623352.1 hypothetical protein CLAFUR0_06482 [Fulvia fulva]UJO19046.1 hypothetical protein CLAFUR5_06621 [Fulvia fulva]WPV16662.1 hypothetical protein CLAFUW4_06477 [Fulvia fulva]WPV31574.1 hypothetical protein CLAFUW7_06477 [Fulvia fulva]
MAEQWDPKALRQNKSKIEVAKLTDVPGTPGGPPAVVPAALRTPAPSTDALPADLPADLQKLVAESGAKPMAELNRKTARVHQRVLEHQCRSQAAQNTQQNSV